MTINLYKFKKRNNSTAQPSNNDGVYPVTGFIFEPCNILRPDIKINFGKENPTGYNYVHIPEFNRYYYVANWTYENGFWRVSCVCDVLASWKEDILASTQYVLRNANQFDGTIMDEMYPLKAQTQYVETNCTPESGSVFTDNYGTGTYVVGIIGPGGGTIGGVAYYSMTNLAFNVFMSKMLSNIDWLNIDVNEISQNIQKILFNPFEYVVSAMWFPVSPGEWSALAGSSVTPTTSLQYGWWQLDLGVPVGRLDSDGSALVQRYNVSIPKHPLAGSRGSYLNTSPFTRRWLNFPPFGRTALDTTTLIGRDELQLVCRIDTVTGKAQLTAGGLENSVCVYSNAQLGVPIQISQIATDYISAITTLGSAAKGFAGAIGGALSIGGVAGGALAGGLLGAGEAGLLMASDKLGGLGGIGNAIQAAFNDVSSSGSNGSLVGYGLKPTLGSLFSIPVDDYPAERGRPLCTGTQLSSLTGFTMCADPDIALNATLEEISAVKSHLANGFYIE